MATVDICWADWQNPGTNVDFPHCFASLRVVSVEERGTWKRAGVTWKCRALIGCWESLYCYSSASRAIWSVTSHLCEGKQACHLSVACAGNVHQMCLPHTRAALRNTSFSAFVLKWRPLECGRRVCFPAGSRHCVFKNNCCKNRHCDSHVVSRKRLC